MPIANIQDTSGVEQKLQDILSNSDVDGRLKAIRELFVGILDYDNADQLVSLESSGNAQLPKDAHVAARRDGVTVAYIPLDDASTNRVNGIVVSAAAKTLGNILSDDLLLLFTNRGMDQLHIISPDLSGSRPKLQRLVAYRDQLQRTVPQQIANMWDSYGNKGKTLREAIAEVFNVEPVTREFFGAYRKLFEAAEEQITGFTTAEEEQKHLFTQTLFNRLMFVYFLSRKGWLRFDGSADYLNALWQDYGSLDGDHGFYTARLKSLFFAGLNNPQSRNLIQDNPVLYRTIGDVPFLNGGLFEETELDKRQDIKVPDETIGHILTDLFDQFNFTVMESTPYDVEVAVDPEMLGKVFEELVTERHSSGAYYTPRPVVSFMCREALKGYLHGKHPEIPEEAIADFVDRQDTSGLTGRGQARAISETLDGMTAVDPACGSGAYLLGMLQELVDLQGCLYNVTEDAKSLYQTKQDIISRNLYGVDKDEFAVNIAMLRLWLSLSIDYDEDDPPPLPNLDFKVVTGDSIAGPDPGRINPSKLGKQTDFLSATGAEITALADLKHQYTGAHGSEKETLKQKIAEAEGTLARQYPTASGFQWHVKFAEVFTDGGFDIAIANPPYVRQEDIEPKIYKDSLVRQYSDAVVARSDLYCYFYARALQLLKGGGMHVFVCSNSWLDVGYGAKLQEYLLNNSHVHAIYESAVERQFSTADINTIISLIGKNPGGKESKTRFVSLRADFDAALANPDLRREITHSRSTLRAAGTSGNKFVGDKWGGKYLRTPDIYRQILSKYSNQLVRLDDVAITKRGIMTGANEFFFLTQETIKQWGIEPEFCHPIMTSPQESRAIAVDQRKLPHRLFICHKDTNSLKDTGALSYIRWGELEGFNARASLTNKRRWYDLGQRTMPEMAMNYVIDTTARTFLVNNSVHFPNVFHTANSRTAAPAKLCAVMNSTLFQLMANLSGRANLGGGALKVELYEFSGIQVVPPIILPDLDETIFSASNWDVLTPSAERKQIDDAVFDTLGMSAGERDGVYEAVGELVRNRKQRAASA